MAPGFALLIAVLALAALAPLVGIAIVVLAFTKWRAFVVRACLIGMVGASVVALSWSQVAREVTWQAAVIVCLASFTLLVAAAGTFLSVRGWQRPNLPFQRTTSRPLNSVVRRP